MIGFQWLVLLGCVFGRIEGRGFLGRHFRKFLVDLVGCCLGLWSLLRVIGYCFAGDFDFEGNSLYFRSNFGPLCRILLGIVCFENFVNVFRVAGVLILIS